MEFGGHPLHVGLWTTTIPRSKWQWNSDYDNGLQIHGATSCVQRMQRVSRVLNKYKLVNKFSLVQTKLGSIHWSGFSLLLGVLHTMLSMCRIFLDPLYFMSLSCHAFYKELKKLLSTNLLWPTLLLHKLPGGVNIILWQGLGWYLPISVQTTSYQNLSHSKSRSSPTEIPTPN